MVSKSDLKEQRDKFLGKYRVPDSGSPDFAEQILDYQTEKKEKEIKERIKKLTGNTSQKNPYYGGPFELDEFLLKLEEDGFFSQTTDKDKIDVDEIEL